VLTKCKPRKLKRLFDRRGELLEQLKRKYEENKK
jgi:hypothetical protein